MLKQLTLAVLAAGLLPACILTTDNTTSDSITGTGSATEAGTTGTASVEQLRPLAVQGERGFIGA